MKGSDKRLWVIGFGLILVGFFIYGLTILRQLSVRTWVPDSALRILLIQKQTKAIKLLVVWPGLQSPELLSFPAEVYLTAVGGYGNYTVEGLLTLGQTEGVGERLLVDSLGFTLASPIHHVYWYSDKNWSKWIVRWQLLSQGLWGKRSLAEAVGMSKLLERVSWSNLTDLELAGNAGLRTRAEIDGSQQRYYDQALLGSFINKHIKTMWPEAAEVQVAVVNGSNMPLMASQWSRLAFVNGFDVVSVTDQPGQQAETELRFSSSDLRDSGPGRALRTLYPLAKVTVGDTTSYRADVSLLVGLDSWQWLNQRGAYLAD